MQKKVKHIFPYLQNQYAYKKSCIWYNTSTLQFHSKVTFNSEKVSIEFRFLKCKKLNNSSEYHVAHILCSGGVISVAYVCTNGLILLCTNGLIFRGLIFGILRYKFNHIQCKTFIKIYSQSRKNPIFGLKTPIWGLLKRY